MILSWNHNTYLYVCFASVRQVHRIRRTYPASFELGLREVRTRRVESRVPRERKENRSMMVMMMMVGLIRNAFVCLSKSALFQLYTNVSHQLDLLSFNRHKNNNNNDNRLVALLTITSCIILYLYQCHSQSTCNNNYHYYNDII